MPKTIYSDIMERLKGRDIRIVMDATGELLLNVLEFKPFLIKPNDQELGESLKPVIRRKHLNWELRPVLQQLSQSGWLTETASQVYITLCNGVLGARMVIFN